MIRSAGTLDGLTPLAPKYVSLDCWRGVACVFVVLYHSALFHLSTTPTAPESLTRATLETMGLLSIGVPIFFVISGYCIAASADATRLKGAGIGTYFVRRFRRIYPPLWAAIVLAALWFPLLDLGSWHLLSTEPWMHPRPWWYSASQWFGNLTLTETWRYHVAGGPRAHFPGQAWTLCYEEQFYAVIGLLLLAPRHLLRGTVLVTAVTLAVVALAPIEGWNVAGFFFDGGWLMFAAGVFVYFVTNYGTTGRTAALLVLLVGSLAVTAAHGMRDWSVAFAFAALILVLKRWDARIVSSPAARPFAACGTMCYSLYLVHQPPVRAIAAAAERLGLRSDAATLFVTVPICLTVSLLLGAAFHRLVERRFLNRAPVGAAAPPAAVPSAAISSVVPG